LRVNVIAPMALAQAFLPALRAGDGRILHMGTSVAHNAQQGSLTYGVTKLAFHRLYQQINAESLGVPCGSISPGMVDTEGVVDHVRKARKIGLPHVKYFDEAYKNEWMTPLSGEQSLMVFVEHLLQMEPLVFSSKEWKYSEWTGTISSDPNSNFGSKL
jgi:NAD(P)-dependent dehydrogenase (short-subunit alcohol dehydrogenase family)